MDKYKNNFHKSRRAELLKQTGKDDPKDTSLILLFGNTFKHKSFDYDYPFKQNKNFFYLTGFTEANSVLLISPAGIKVKDGKGKLVTAKEILFVQPKDKLKETWTGRRLGAENVKKELGIECGLVNTEIYNVLLSALTSEVKNLYLNIPEYYSLTGEMKKYMSDFHERLFTMSTNVQLIDINYTLAKMRSRKTDYEINRMKISADICVNAFEDAIIQMTPGLFEYQIQSVLEYNYKAYGAMDLAFDTIVAGGNNACTLHYETNLDVLKNGDLALIDSGADFDYYCSDITRTIPVNGRFSKEQAEIYNAVLKVQKNVIKKIKPGVRLSALKKYTVDVLAKEMIRMKLMKNEKDIIKYYMHGVGHHLGLDTHDAVKNTRGTDDYDVLKEGNVITVEPGLYIPGDAKEIPVKYRGIGVRIEDDILVTKKGSENLTVALPKEIHDIEAMMKLEL